MRKDARKPFGKTFSKIMQARIATWDLVILTTMNLQHQKTHDNKMTNRYETCDTDQKRSALAIWGVDARPPVSQSPFLEKSKNRGQARGKHLTSCLFEPQVVSWQLLRSTGDPAWVRVGGGYFLEENS